MQRIHRAIFLTLGAAAGMVLAFGSAAAYSPLCDGVPTACDYAGPDAPILQADVCWNGGSASLKGTSNCPSGTSPYYVEYGELETTGAVQAYVSLPDGCARGYCLAAPDPYPWTLEGELCCTGTAPNLNCTLSVLDCSGEIIWCENYTNTNGEIDCYEVDE
jgi:hypothetical protein